MILSGGGNDLLDKFDRCLLNFKGDRDDQTVTSDMILDSNGLKQLCAELEERYQTWFTKVSKCMSSIWRNSIPMLIHSYACPNATGPGLVRWYFYKEGPWLQPHFVSKGYVPQINTKEKQNVVEKAFDGLAGAMQCAIKAYNRSNHNQIHYVDVRGIVTIDHWHDQIHLNTDGCDVVAKKLGEVLASL